MKSYLTKVMTAMVSPPRWSWQILWVLLLLASGFVGDSVNLMFLNKFFYDKLAKKVSVLVLFVCLNMNWVAWMSTCGLRSKVKASVVLYKLAWGASFSRSPSADTLPSPFHMLAGTSSISLFHVIWLPLSTLSNRVASFSPACQQIQSWVFSQVTLWSL